MIPHIEYGHPIDEYHADPAIGSTGLKRAARSVLHFATPDHRDSDAMRLGRFAHSLILEPATVWQQYARPFVVPDGLIADTSAGLKEACAEHGLPVTGKKDVLSDRLREIGVSLEIDAWDAWRHENAERVPVTAEDIERAEAMRDSMKRLDLDRMAAGLPAVLPPNITAETNIW